MGYCAADDQHSIGIRTRLDGDGLLGLLEDKHLARAGRGIPTKLSAGHCQPGHCLLLGWHERPPSTSAQPEHQVSDAIGRSRGAAHSVVRSKDHAGRPGRWHSFCFDVLALDGCMFKLRPECEPELEASDPG